MGGPGGFADAARRVQGSSLLHPDGKGLTLTRTPSLLGSRFTLRLTLTRTPHTHTHTGTWRTELQWEAGVWGSHAGAGNLEVVRDANASAAVVRRSINRVEVAMPESELEVNGKALSFLPYRGGSEHHTI